MTSDPSHWHHVLGRVTGEFLHNGPFAAGHDVAVLDAVDVGRNCNHAVGIMPGDVGVDGSAGDRLGLLL
jgi:hypothetical protein